MEQIDKTDKKANPPKTKINFENFPKEMRKQKFWLFWKWKWDGNRWTKKPCTQTGGPLKAQNAIWSFKEVSKDYEKNNSVDGVGYYFSPDQPFFGLDFDNCINEAGKISKEVRKHIKKLNTYIEYSPSGQGLHGIGSGNKKINGVDTSIVFHNTRYFTFTGAVVHDANVAKCGALVNDLFGLKGQGKAKGKNASTASQMDPDVPFSEIETLVKLIIPNVDGDVWTKVIRAVHFKTDGSQEGYDLLLNWSIGKYCLKKEQYEFVEGETEEQRLAALDYRWNKCKDPRQGEKMVGMKTLRSLSENWKTNKKQRKRKNFSFAVPKGLKIPIKDRRLSYHPYNGQELKPKHFPKVLRKAAEEIARFNKVPFDAVATSILVCLSAAINKKVRITEREDLHHNCSIGTIIAMPSGGRKSAIDNQVMRPFFEAEKRKIVAWKKDKIRREMLLTFQKAVLKTAEKELNDLAVEGCDPEDVPVHVHERIKAASQEIAKLSIPQPKLSVGDITEEKLSDELERHNGIMFAQSDDGRNMMKNMIGRYDSTGEGIYICGITGSDYKRSRVKDDIDQVIHNPCINLSIKVQLDKMREFVMSEGMRESGLMARLFLKVYNIDIGKQIAEQEDEPALNWDALDGYYDIVEEIMNYDGPPINVVMSKEAAQMRRELTREYSKITNEQGDWHGNHDITNKMVSLSVKLASNICVSRNPSRLKKVGEQGFMKTIEISKKDYAMAKAIVLILMAQTINVIRSLENNDLIKRANDLMDRLEGKAHYDKSVFLQKNGYFTESTCIRFYSANSRMLVPQLLSLLENNGLIERMEDPKHFGIVKFKNKKKKDSKKKKR